MFLKIFGYKRRLFWEIWALSFSNEKQQTILHDYNLFLCDYILKKNCKTIEIGCGFGRNIKYLIENGLKPYNICGIDISRTMLRKAKKFIANDKVKLFKYDITTKTQFKDMEFDLVAVIAVLMHVPPDKLMSAICEIARIGKSIILMEQSKIEFKNINSYPSKHTESSYYTYEHNYPYYFAKIGYKCEMLFRSNDILIYNILKI